jgi:tetratricopeptide (TPR) repeat protein
MSRWSVLLTLACLLAAAPAHAQPAPEPPAPNAERADEAFRRGADAYGAGHYQEAARAFETAHRLSPHPDAAFNAARAHEQAGDRPRAADLYETAMRLSGLSAEFADYASAHLAALKRTLSVLSITTPLGATASVAHVSDASIPVVVHVEPGRHMVRLTAPGKRAAEHAVEVTAGETKRLDLGPLESVTQLPVTQPPPPADDGLAPNVVVGLSLIGVAAASLASGIGVGFAALDANDRWEASGLTDLDARQQAVTLRTVANVGYFGALASAVAGSVILFVPFGDDDASLALGLDGLRLRAAF